MRKLCMLLLSLILSSPIFAIGFGYHVFEVRTEPEFSHGVFPSSVKYQFNFPMPDFISDRRTILAFRLDNGLVYRNLRQDPETGELLAIKGHDYPTEYTVLFDEFNLFFAQGFWETRNDDKDLFTAFISIDGRFENAYERLSWLTGPGELEGVFNTFAGGSKTERFPDSSWTGAPELRGSRSMFQTSVTAGFIVDWMDDAVTRRDGVRFSSYLRLSPTWMPLSTGSASFIVSWNELELSKTLYSAEQDRRKELSWFSLVLDDKITYRYIYGSKVPAYVQGGDIWGRGDVPNAAHVITNRLSLSIYGPQINSRDSYPAITIFWDIGFGVGQVLNRGGVKDRIFETVGSYGIRAEFLIFGIIELYYELGCSYDGPFNEGSYVEQRFGVTVGI